MSDDGCLGDGVCTDPRCARHGIGWTNGTGSVQVGAQSPEPLRVALEKLDASVQVVDAYDDEVPLQSFWDLFGAASAVLKAHPAEPVAVSDEAVEAAAKASYEVLAPVWRWIDLSENEKDMRRQRARAALDTTLPHLQPQPVASREQLSAALRVFIAKAYSAGMSRYNSGKINPPAEAEKLDALTNEAVDDLFALVVALMPTAATGEKS